MNSIIKIVLVEDYELEKEGLLRMLSDYQDLKVVHCASNGLDLLNWLESNQTDIILLDIKMSVMGGSETMDKLAKKHPTLKVIMLTEYFTDEYVAEFMRKGARAFLSKNNRISKVVETIRRVHTNGICIDTLVSNILTKRKVIVLPNGTIDDRPDLDLSAREIEIIRLMCQGLQTDEIAEKLHKAPKTIEHQRASIKRKTNCSRLPDLMDFAFKQNIITF